MALPPGFGGSTGPASFAGPEARWRTGLRATGFATVALCSGGLLTWAVIGYLAYRRRSALHAWFALGYLLISGVMIAVMSTWEWDNPDEPASDSDFFSLPGMVIPPFFGAAHAVLLVVLEHLDRRSGVIITAETTREANRERARQILAYHPQMARELGIGRPDLFRWYDDGGLVDVNHVPEALLAGLPGMDPALARHLVWERKRAGGFVSLHDLIARGALPPAQAHGLQHLLIFGG